MGLLIAAVAGFAACAFFPATPKEVDLANADYGPRPENVDAAVNEWMKGYLNDPFSAVVERSGELRKGWWREYKSGDLLLPAGLARTYVVKYGWVLPAKINAKNKFGAYTGFKSYELYFQGEKIVAYKLF